MNGSLWLAVKSDDSVIKTMYFYLSLGSNIEPERSAVQMLQELVGRFGCLALFPFCFTEPEKIVSERMFANALVVLKSPLDLLQVKTQLVEIETRMGRDRDDPQRSNKSRAADIDIIAASSTFALSFFEQANEAYVQTCLALEGPFVDLSPWGLAAHQRPATVHLDAAAAQIVVVEDEAHGFIDWAESALTS
ncbi:2-amino-4-hydroxy-6-hydroxymethyldihydropteridine diphosphokinase [Agaribacterium sp. ZY112]|uniref:2-amino-4-hydroxy-6- hydroxymethyldihydropteridine diphosphokinase n=1 Tax=Agaribacterium sp. ZY112 TaxID=3233574 RepID=UPI00352417E6